MLIKVLCYCASRYLHCWARGVGLCEDTEASQGTDGVSDISIHYHIYVFWELCLSPRIQQGSWYHFDYHSTTDSACSNRQLCKKIECWAISILWWEIQEIWKQKNNQTATPCCVVYLTTNFLLSPVIDVSTHLCIYCKGRTYLGPRWSTRHFGLALLVSENVLPLPVRVSNKGVSAGKMTLIIIIFARLIFNYIASPAVQA